MTSTAWKASRKALEEPKAWTTSSLCLWVAAAAKHKKEKLASSQLLAESSAPWPTSTTETLSISMWTDSVSVAPVMELEEQIPPQCRLATPVRVGVCEQL